VNSFERAWELVGQSFAVLRKDKKLILFPILSALSTLAIAAAYVVPLFSLHIVSQYIHGGGVAPATYAWLFLWYCSNYFAMIFFNCALASCAQTRFSGGEPTLGGGVGRAAERLGSILMWAIVSATVGVILRIIEQRSRALGRIVSSLIGIAWAVATYFIVPVLVLEDRDVFSSIRRSSELLRKTWGEGISAGLGFGLPQFLLSIPGILLIVLGGRIHPAAIAIGVLYMLLVTVLMSAVRGVFTVALYRFATQGEAPAGFSPVVLNGAFVNLRK